MSEFKAKPCLSPLGGKFKKRATFSTKEEAECSTVFDWAGCYKSVLSIVLSIQI
jgi:hypothetical protein